LHAHCRDHFFSHSLQEIYGHFKISCIEDREELIDSIVLQKVKQLTKRSMEQTDAKALVKPLMTGK
jgi:hypothetical protein